MLYFAYGSNLDAEQMRRRCPRSRFVDVARLDHHALTFTGYSARWRGAVATVVQRRGITTDGVLYDLDGDDLRALDGFEGHPVSYRRQRKYVRRADGSRVLAHVYIRSGRDPIPPPAEYFLTIHRAYRRLGFDRKALERAIAQTSFCFQTRTVLS